MNPNRTGPNPPWRAEEQWDAGESRGSKPTAAAAAEQLLCPVTAQTGRRLLPPPHGTGMILREEFKLQPLKSIARQSREDCCVRNY